MTIVADGFRDSKFYWRCLLINITVKYFSPKMQKWYITRKKRDKVERDSFLLVPEYAQRVWETDPETSTQIEINKSTKRCEGIFVAPGAVRRMWRGLRQLYVLDGAPTTGSKYGMTLLVLVGLDGDGNLLPLCWAVVPTENEYWWGYFLRHFKKTFGGPAHGLGVECTNDCEYVARIVSWKEMVLIRGHENGWAEAVECQIPKVVHTYCREVLAKKMEQNFGAHSAEMFRSIANAATPKAFKEQAEKMSKLKHGEVEYLRNIPTDKWAAVARLSSHYGQHTISMAYTLLESWNELRQLPILQMLDGLMVWMASIFKARSLELLDTDNKGASTNGALKAYKEIARKAEALVVVKEISGGVYEVERGGGGGTRGGQASANNTWSSRYG
jgi:hypothetical protein